MAKSKSHIPDGFHALTPYLIVPGAGRLIEFLKRAFGAEEVFRSDRPDGTIGHAQVKIGDSMLEMGEAGGQWQPTPCSLHLYVPDSDATYRRALEAGATSLSEPVEKFYGDREAAVRDPSGNQWFIATHVEDVSAEEMERRAKAAAKQGG